MRISRTDAGQVAVGDLAGGEVDRDVEAAAGRGAARASRAAWRQALSMHPAADRLDQAALLGDRDELAGVEQAAPRMVPAHQRLEAGDLAAAQRDDRLVVQRQLVAPDRAAQLVLELQPARRARARISSSNSS